MCAFYDESGFGGLAAQMRSTSPCPLSTPCRRAELNPLDENQVKLEFRSSIISACNRSRTAKGYTQPTYSAAIPNGNEPLCAGQTIPGKPWLPRERGDWRLRPCRNRGGQPARRRDWRTEACLQPRSRPARRRPGGCLRRSLACCESLAEKRTRTRRTGSQALPAARVWLAGGVRGWHRGHYRETRRSDAAPQSSPPLACRRGAQAKAGRSHARRRVPRSNHDGLPPAGSGLRGQGPSWPSAPAGFEADDPGRAEDPASQCLWLV